MKRAWGSPIITKEMIKGYADEGFGVLRIPVSWSNMMGEDYTINADYVARVKEVVNWALDSGMYVILNLHWTAAGLRNFRQKKKSLCTNTHVYGHRWRMLLKTMATI